MKSISITEQKRQIEYELADLQCLESCMEQGFNIHDWIVCKSNTLEFMKARLALHEDVEFNNKSNV